MKKVIKYALIPLFELGLFGAATPSIVDIKKISINVNSHVSYLDYVEPFSDLCEEYYSFNKVTLTRRSFPNASFDALFINNVYQDTDIESDSYTIDAFSKDMDIDNYYTDTSLATVYVIDSSNRLLGYKSFVKDSLLDLKWLKTLEDEQFVPHSYVFDNFYYQNEVVDSPIVLDRSIVVQSRVKENGSAKKYNVLVNRADGTKDFLNCEFDKTLTLVSTLPFFSYWEVGDKIVSYKDSYTFSVYSNLVINEVCKGDVEKQPIINLYNDDVNVEGMDNIYEVRYELPDTCSFVEAGMIFDGEDIYSPNKVIAQNRTSNNEFSVRYDSTPEKVKAYLIYRDGSEVKVIYHEGFEVDHLVFFSTGADSTTSYTASNFPLNSIFKSGITVSAIDKVYKGSDSTLKFSSAKANGFLNLATSNSVNKIRVNASKYQSDSASLTINQVTKEFDASFKSYDFEFDSTNTIEIRATKRCYISSIELFYSKETKVFTLDNLTLGDLSNVTTDIELPSTHEGYVVSWSSSDEDVVTSTGRVTRFLDDKEVILTATCNGLTKDFNVTVKGNSKNAIIITDEEKTQYSSYYSSIDNSLSLGMDGTLCSRLTTLLYPKGFYTYKGSDVGQTGYELIALNEDPSNPDNMIMFYTQDSIVKQPCGDGDVWNREHVWCQSLSYATEYGKDKLYGETKGGVDILHLMPTYRNVNSTRNNRRYDEIPSGEEKYFNNCYYGKIGKEDNFEPRDDVKGDAARICLYMWVVYLKAHGSKITNVATSLEMLVRWSNEDKPSQIEKNRNNLAQKGKQQNRNPFVDHPEWVNYIFGAEYNA